MHYPSLEHWRHDRHAQIFVSLLDKSPLPVAELRVRTDLHESELAATLRGMSEEYGEYLITYPPDDSGQKTLAEAIRCGPAFFFSHLGYDRSRRQDIRNYLFRSLAKGIKDRCVSAAVRN